MTTSIITLDGPAGSGKSTVARQLAQRLGYDFLDTGAMYRGVAAWTQQLGIDPQQESDVIAHLPEFEMAFDWQTDPPTLMLNGQRMTDELRQQDVTNIVSLVAAIPQVREKLVELQQQIGREHPRLVTEGRDQGAVVFPNALVKFYLDASVEVRAQRRTAQLREQGMKVDEQEIRQQIAERDRLDSQRKDAPLRCPKGAIRLDTSDMTLLQVVDELERIARKHINGQAPGALTA